MKYWIREMKREMIVFEVYRAKDGQNERYIKKDGTQCLTMSIGETVETELKPFREATPIEIPMIEELAKEDREEVQ